MNNVVNLRASPEPEASPYAPPLSFELLRALSELNSANVRLKGLTSGNYVTTTNLAQVPELLKEIGRLSIAAAKAVRNV